MADIESPRLDRVFQALASPTRRGLIRRLADGPATVGALAEPLQSSLATVSKHLLYLESAGLIARTVAGRQTICELRSGGLEEARSLLEVYASFWERQLDSMQSHLEGDG